MKKRLSRLLCAALLLSLGASAFADLEGEPQQCVELLLEANPSTGYLWQITSSDEEIAYVQQLSSTPLQTDGVGAPCIESYRIAGSAPGEAEITFVYSRPWESVQPLYHFTVPVTVDEGLNVLTGSRISLPREEGTGWSFEMQQGDVLEITDWGGEEEDQLFTLAPLEDGTEEITFTLFSPEAQLPDCFVYRIVSRDDALYTYEIEFKTQSSPLVFSPAFQFSTEDLQGNTVTEQVFANKLTVLNFWEPWCGPCVAEMPFLEKLSLEYADQGVQVIGVFATKDADEEVLAALERTGATYPILRYVKEFGQLQTGYVPTTVIIDGSGAIVYGPVAGALNYAGWCALIEELL